MTIYYLYLKEHKDTKLKYLGQTIQNPFLYKGSGKRWTNHLKVHGNNVSTTILKECLNRDELKHWGFYYSNLWNIVENKDFANCTFEEGSGGRTVDPITRIGKGNPMYGKKIPCSKERRLSVIRGKNQPNYDLYKTAIELMDSGKSADSVSKELGIGRGVCFLLKKRTHGIFQVFPELI
jgi:hypothetical protein